MALLPLLLGCTPDSAPPPVALPPGVWVDFAPEVTSGTCALPPAPGAIAVRTGNTLDGAGVAELSIPPYTALAIDGNPVAGDGVAWVDGPRQEGEMLVGAAQQADCAVSFRATLTAALPEQDPGGTDGLWVVDTRLMRLSSTDTGAVLAPEADGIAIGGPLVGTLAHGLLEVARTDVEVGSDGSPFLTTTTTLSLPVEGGSGIGTLTTALDWASEKSGADATTSVDVAGRRLDVDLGVR